MKIPDINLNHFKVFMAVYETRSMTQAADILHLTQSGVSQHIKALEEDLKLSLFTRSGRKIIPTPLASEIFPDIELAFLKVTERLARTTGREPEVNGLVRIGMPVEFGTGVLVPKLSMIGQNYRRLNFDITLDYAPAICSMLTNGQLDFGFIDEAPMDRRLHYRLAAKETLLLCAHRAYVAAKPKVSYNQSYFESLDYVEYKGSEPILRRWMTHHLKRKNLKLNVRAHIMDVQGVAKFIVSGIGAGVLPHHVVEKLKSEGSDIFVYEGKASPLNNEIRAISLKHHPLTKAAELTLNELMNSFATNLGRPS